MNTQTVLKQMSDVQAALEAHQASMAARLDIIEQISDQRICGLEAANADLRHTLLLAGEVLNDIKRTCERHGWSEHSGISVTDWLDHVLGMGGSDGWPSLN